MPQLVEVGDQIVEFPDGMSDADMAAAIRRDMGVSEKATVAPYDDSGRTGEARDASKGYLANVRNPVDLMRKESLPANAMAVATGNTRAAREQKRERFQGEPALTSMSSRLSELEAAGKTESPEYAAALKEYDETAEALNRKPEFTFKALRDAFASDPGAVVAEFQNAILSDPELMLTPLGWEKAAAVTAAKLAKAGKAVQTTGKVAAGATGAAATGASVVAPISAARQLNEAGEIDSGKLVTETGLGAAGGAAVGGVFQAGKALLRPRAEVTPHDDTAEVVSEVMGTRTVNDAIDAAEKTTGQVGQVDIPLAGKPRRFLDRVVPRDDRIRIDNLLNRWEGDIATGRRATWQLQEQIKKLVPSKERREAISHYLEGDQSIQLGPEEQKAAAAVREFFQGMGEVARQEDVIRSYLPNYVPHLWDRGSQKKIENLVQELSGRAKMSTTTQHARQRVIPTLREGMDLGLKPKTLDIAEVAKLYGDAVNRAVRNKQLVDALAGVTDTEGQNLVMRADKAPNDYVLLSHPSLHRPAFVKEGDTTSKTMVPVKVHPDIAPSLKFVFESTEPNIATRSLLALNFAAKRSLVSMSFFHANALLESMLMAGRLPTAIPSALSMLRNGKAGDVVDTALRAGLKIGTIEDVGPDVFYGALKDIQAIADKHWPLKPIGVAAKGIEKVNRVIDNVMWDKIATGGKLSVFMKEFEKATLRNIKDHKKNPAKHPLIPEDEIAQSVAEYVNDAFGGLNWRRIAEGVENRMGRDFALATNSPAGRRAMQLMFFAPDWTLANIRILGKALPGMSRDKIQRKLHRAYAMRGALMWATVGDGLNVMLSAHHFWENRDPGYIDLGDGRKLTFSKQFREPFEWLAKPGKTFLNKLGVLPKELLSQAMNQKWLSPHGAPRIVKKGDTLPERTAARAGHAAENFVPIFVQQFIDQGPAAGASGFLGHPIYGAKRPKSRREWEQLEPGERYIDPTGTARIKSR